jgi:hypothetical protein
LRAEGATGGLPSGDFEGGEGDAGNTNIGAAGGAINDGSGGENLRA